MQLEKRWGRKEENSEVVSAIDEIFFSDEKEDGTNFKKLLPKLYLDEYNPATNNFIVKEDGKVKAAVGLYYNDIYVCGEKLLCGGIGNVGVTLDSRSKGYMKDAMNGALKNMIENGADFGELGGQRQRYNYFSFEQSGDKYKFFMYINNIRHPFGFERKTDFVFEELKKDDTETIKKINRLHKSGYVYCDRKDEDVYNVLCSWSRKPYVLTLCGEFKGYIVIAKNSCITELKVCDINDMVDCTLAIFNLIKDERFSLCIPKYDNEYADFFIKICESMSCYPSAQYTILNFEKMINAFLNLKSKISPLCDGTIVFEINGYAKREKLRISVKNNIVSVNQTDEKNDFYFEHLDAISTIFGYSTEKNKLPANIASWFPLSLSMYDADNV